MLGLLVIMRRLALAKLLLLVTMASVGIGLTGCPALPFLRRPAQERPFPEIPPAPVETMLVPTAIPRDRVPPEHRRGVEDLAFHEGSRPRNVIWHVFHSDKDYSWSAATFDGEVRAGSHSRFYMIEVRARGQLLGAFVANYRREPFYGSPGYGYNEVGGRRVYDLVGTGAALDRSVKRIEAITTRGRAVQGRLENGFWVVVLPDAAEDEAWAQVSAHDAQGNVLHALID